MFNLFLGSLFIGSIQRNRLLHVDSTRTQLAPSNTEIGAFSVSSTAADVVACYEDGRRLFSWRPVVFIAELPSAQFMKYVPISSCLWQCNVHLLICYCMQHLRGNSQSGLRCCNHHQQPGYC